MEVHQDDVSSHILVRRQSIEYEQRKHTDRHSYIGNHHCDPEFPVKVV